MAARPLPKGDNPNQITINSDGTWTPTGGVTINPSGTVQFDLPTYKTGYNQCIIAFTISWGNQPVADPPGTIIVGS
jgi:hypothetical protein